MKFLYENLEITKLARLLFIKIYQITESFPKQEFFGLVAQSRRASISVLLNIAEGSGRFHKKDFAKFIRNSIASLIEVDTAIKIAIELKYIDQGKYSTDIPLLIEKLFYKSIAFEKSLIGKRFQRTA